MYRSREGPRAGARDPRRPGQEEEEEEVSMELLPCPFCGGGAKFVKTSDVIVPGRVEVVAWNVKCSRCFASPLSNNYEGSKEAAAERWNRRAERTCRYVRDHMGVAGNWFCKCSECGAEFDERVVDRHFVYCPMCGAKVVGE